MTIAGKWNTELKTPMGLEPGSAEFTVDGDRLTGTLTSQHGPMPVEGSVSGDQAAWAGYTTRPMPMTLNFDVTVNGDAFAGTVKVGLFGKVKFAGTRA